MVDLWYAGCKGIHICFFFYCYGDHRDLHRVDRRQRQMCIRDRMSVVIDASVTMQWYFQDEFSSASERLLQRIVSELSLIHISEPTRPY